MDAVRPNDGEEERGSKAPPRQVSQSLLFFSPDRRVMCGGSSLGAARNAGQLSVARSARRAGDLLCVAANSKKIFIFLGMRGELYRRCWRLKALTLPPSYHH